MKNYCLSILTFLSIISFAQKPFDDSNFNIIDAYDIKTELFYDKNINFEMLVFPEKKSIIFKGTSKYYIYYDCITNKNYEIKEDLDFNLKNSYINGNDLYLLIINKSQSAKKILKLSLTNSYKLTKIKCSEAPNGCEFINQNYIDEIFFSNNKIINIGDDNNLILNHPFSNNNYKSIRIWSLNDEKYKVLKKKEFDTQTQNLAYSQNYKKVKQQIENGTYKRENQPLQEVKNHHWWNDEELNNFKSENIAINQEFEKYKHIKPKVYKEFFDGSESVTALVHSYTGTLNSNSRLPEGKGTFKIGLGRYVGNAGANMGKPLYQYIGEWKNGQFDGEGSTYNKYYADTYCSYKGSWKNSKYNGKGILTEAFTEGKVEFLVYDGDFSNGKKNGKFKIYGQFRDQVNRTIWIQDLTQSLYKKFGFIAEAEYKNDELVKYSIIEDQEDKLNTYFAEIYQARKEAAQQVKIEKCIKCEIDFKKSTYPREEDNFLWPGTSHRTGEIVMKNGDKYNFDYKDGKCKVINGWFETDDYYPNFIKMVENLENKCSEKYCK